MKRVCFALLLCLIVFASMSMIIRHDVADAKYIALAKNYPQLCHLPDGEATLIGENWFVTAAHVAVQLENEIKNGLIPKVRLGNRSYEVTKVILHPKYELTETAIENDIALFQIKGKIDNIPFAKLYPFKDEVGKKITIVGRGDFGTGLTGAVSRDKITRAATNIIDATLDQWLYFKFDAPDSENTTKLEGVSGPGDSGGPAFVDIDGIRYIIGVSSHQRSNGIQGVYGVTEYYARISMYKNWIKQHLP